MPIPDFLQIWGHLLYENPTAFVVLAVIVFGLTWKVFSVVSAGENAALKARITELGDQLKQVSQAKPSLTEKQYGEIVRTLMSQARAPGKDLGGERVVVIEIGVGFMENVDIAQQLRDAAEDAGWKSTISLGRPDPKYANGIWILGSGDEPGGLPATRSILKAALGSAGLQAQEAEENQGLSDAHPYSASVVIGRLEPA